ncbi:putative spermidine/putrescine transport system ATP-binding protein [Sporosarcina luteola]|nr:putative spermidine/putrescine transport system ATP-binding protein [Sporosarcina luteola]
MQKEIDVDIQGISLSYGKTKVLKEIDLQIEQGELLTLLGPSGCGKSTTLNIIAGFLEQDAGQLFIKGKKMNNVPSYKRDLGMVFQTYSLFPHMTVYDNLAFGLKLRKVGKEAMDEKIERSLKLVRMNGLEDRYPKELSGGQRQRVAIARALVVEPTLLLLDEPLSNLDAKLRHELRTEIKRMQNEVGVTTVFVTHDQDEALSMSDRIVIMNDGKIEQIGTPTEIYQNPKTEFVFRFIGSSTKMEGILTEIRDASYVVKLANELSLEVSKDNYLSDAAPSINEPINLYIRPEQCFFLNETNQNKLDVVLPATVSQMNYLGASWEVEVQVIGADQKISLVTQEVNEHVKVGSEVEVGWKLECMKISKSAI